MRVYERNPIIAKGIRVFEFFFLFITLFFTIDNGPFLLTKCRYNDSTVIFNMMYWASCVYISSFLFLWQFFEYSTLQEIRYNTREPAGCVVADPVSTFLTMHHCSKPREAVPEDQKFLFREVRSLIMSVQTDCMQMYDCMQIEFYSN